MTDAQMGAVVFAVVAIIHALWRQSQANAARRRLEEHQQEMRRLGHEP